MWPLLYALFLFCGLWLALVVRKVIISCALFSSEKHTKSTDKDREKSEQILRYLFSKTETFQGKVKENTKEHNEEPTVVLFTYEESEPFDKKIDIKSLKEKLNAKTGDPFKHKIDPESIKNPSTIPSTKDEYQEQRGNLVKSDGDVVKNAQDPILLSSKDVVQDEFEEKIDIKSNPETPVKTETNYDPKADSFDAKVDAILKATSKIIKDEKHALDKKMETIKASNTKNLQNNEYLQQKIEDLKELSVVEAGETNEELGIQTPRVLTDKFKANELRTIKPRDQSETITLMRNLLSRPSRNDTDTAPKANTHKTLPLNQFRQDPETTQNQNKILYKKEDVTTRPNFSTIDVISDQTSPLFSHKKASAVDYSFLEEMDSETYSLLSTVVKKAQRVEAMKPTTYQTESDITTVRNKAIRPNNLSLAHSTIASDKSKTSEGHPREDKYTTEYKNPVQYYHVREDTKHSIKQHQYVDDNSQAMKLSATELDRSLAPNINVPVKPSLNPSVQVHPLELRVPQNNQTNQFNTSTNNFNNPYQQINPFIPYSGKLEAHATKHQNSFHPDAKEQTYYTQPYHSQPGLPGQKTYRHFDMNGQPYSTQVNTMEQPFYYAPYVTGEPYYTAMNVTGTKYNMRRDSTGRPYYYTELMPENTNTPVVGKSGQNNDSQYFNSLGAPNNASRSESHLKEKVIEESNKLNFDSAKKYDRSGLDSEKPKDLKVLKTTKPTESIKQAATQNHSLMSQQETSPSWSGNTLPMFPFPEFQAMPTGHNTVYNGLAAYNNVYYNPDQNSYQYAPGMGNYQPNMYQTKDKMQAATVYYNMVVSPTAKVRSVSSNQQNVRSPALLNNMQGQHGNKTQQSYKPSQVYGQANWNTIQKPFNQQQFMSSPPPLPGLFTTPTNAQIQFIQDQWNAMQRRMNEGNQGNLVSNQQFQYRYMQPATCNYQGYPATLSNIQPGYSQPSFIQTGYFQPGYVQQNKSYYNKIQPETADSSQEFKGQRDMQNEMLNNYQAVWSAYDPPISPQFKINALTANVEKLCISDENKKTDLNFDKKALESNYSATPENDFTSKTVHNMQIPKIVSEMKKKKSRTQSVLTWFFGEPEKNMMTDVKHLQSNPTGDVDQSTGNLSNLQQSADVSMSDKKVSNDSQWSSQSQNSQIQSEHQQQSYSQNHTIPDNYSQQWFQNTQPELHLKSQPEPEQGPQIKEKPSSSSVPNRSRRRKSRKDYGIKSNEDTNMKFVKVSQLRLQKLPTTILPEIKVENVKNKEILPQTDKEEQNCVEIKLKKKLTVSQEAIRLPLKDTLKQETCTSNIVFSLTEEQPTKIEKKRVAKKTRKAAEEWPKCEDIKSTFLEPITAVSLSAFSPTLFKDNITTSESTITTEQCEFTPMNEKIRTQLIPMNEKIRTHIPAAVGPLPYYKPDEDLPISAIIKTVRLNSRIKSYRSSLDDKSATTLSPPMTRSCSMLAQKPKPSKEDYENIQCSKCCPPPKCPPPKPKCPPPKPKRKPVCVPKTDEPCYRPSPV